MPKSTAVATTMVDPERDAGKAAPHRWRMRPTQPPARTSASS
jgi:hypothetical protein